MQANDAQKKTEELSWSSDSEAEDLDAALADALSGVPKPRVRQDPTARLESMVDRLVLDVEQRLEARVQRAIASVEGELQAVLTRVMASAALDAATVVRRELAAGRSVLPPPQQQLPPVGEETEEASCGVALSQ